MLLLPLFSIIMITTVVIIIMTIIILFIATIAITITTGRILPEPEKIPHFGGLWVQGLGFAGLGFRV